MKNKIIAKDEFFYLSDFSNGILTKDPKRSISSPSNSLRLWKLPLEKNNQDTKSEPQNDMKQWEVFTPCRHKGDKTLVGHNLHLGMPCRDFPSKLQVIIKIIRNRVI